MAKANKLGIRVVLAALDHVDLRVASIQGGGLRNAIPRESKTTLVCAQEDLAALESALTESRNTLNAEHATTDPDLIVEWNAAALPGHVMGEEDQYALLLAIQTCPVGIHRMSPDIAGLVQTSNNLARVDVKDGQVEIQCLNRSSVDSEKDDHARIEAAFARQDSRLSEVVPTRDGPPTLPARPWPCAATCTKSATTRHHGCLLATPAWNAASSAPTTPTWTWCRLAPTSEARTAPTNAFK